MEDALLNISMKMVARLTVLKQPNARSRDMRQQKIIKGSFYRSMVQCHMAFQDLFKKGIKLCKVEDMEVTREEGKKTTTVGDNGMAMEGVTVECQVEITEANTMMVKVDRQLTLNKEEMEGVKVEHKVELTVEYNIAFKVVQMEGNVVEEMGVAKARALG